MGKKATGASALFGVSIDGSSDLYSIGHPNVSNTVVAAPGTALTATAGSSGNLTGTFIYRVGYGQPNGALTSPAFSTTAVLTAVGTPHLDDATESGTFTGTGIHTWDIIIDTAGTPDKFKWRKDSGVWTIGVSVTGSAQLLSDAVSVTFGATTGHALGDHWKITTEVDSAPVTVSGKILNLTVVPTSADPSVDKRVIERSDDGGLTWAICGTIYDNTTATFTDNVAVLDKSKVLPLLNQTGSNYGYTFLEPDSFDLEPDFAVLPVVALRGTAGQPRAIPGPIKITGSPKADVRPAELLPIITAGGGLPDSYSQVSGEPTWIATWSATTGKRNPRTMSAFAYQGSPTVAPNFLYQIATDELDFTFTGGKIDQITPKFTGANYGISAPSVPLSGNTGAWTGSFVAIGQRYDAAALTDSVFIKITDVLAANVVKFQVSVDTHASAGTGTYGGPQIGELDPSTTKYSLTRNATSKLPTKAGLQYSDAIEIADQNGIYLGADVGSNRQPFLVMASAAFDTGDLLVDDIYEILPTAAIPGVGAAPFSGVPARFAQGPRFTDAHVTIIQDGNVIEATAGSVKFMWPKKAVNALCAGARTVLDMPNEGFFKVDLTITRFLDSTTYRQVLRTDSRAVVRIALEGERIPINPGVLSTKREALYIDIPQVRFTSVKAPVTGQVLVVETIVAEAEQPDSPEADLYNLTLQTRQAWTLPS